MPGRSALRVQVAQADAGNGRAANDKQNHTPGSRKKRKMITRKNESLTSCWFEWREGIELLDLPLEQVCRGGYGLRVRRVGVWGYRVKGYRRVGMGRR